MKMTVKSLIEKYNRNTGAMANRINTIESKYSTEGGATEEERKEAQLLLKAIDRFQPKETGY